MRAQAKTQQRRAQQRLTLPPTESGTSGVLAPYFGSLQEIPLLEPKQELVLAREIEALEIAHYRALLSHPPALALLASVIEPLLPGASRWIEPIVKLERARVRASQARDKHAREPQKRRRDAALARAAHQLRELDPTRAAQRAADAAVRESFAAVASARAYLARVARACAAEQAAKGRFVAANLRLVIAMTRRYHRSMLPLEDLIQEGNLGLMRAVDSFDHRRGYRFSTYAAWWIRHALNRAVSDKARLVRIPVHALDDLSRIGRATDRLSRREGSAPSVQELANETGLSADKIERLKGEAMLRHPYSLDQELGGDQDRNLHEILPAEVEREPEQALDLGRYRGELYALLNELKPIEASILRLRFGLDGGEELTLAEVGERYNLSRERIRQLQAQALGVLRQAIAARRASGDGHDHIAA